MRKQVSAGLLMYRLNSAGIEVLLAHPGGPIYEDKECGYWGIPKGQVERNETPFAAAVREFTEETGFAPAFETVDYLGDITERSGKRIHIWCFEGDCDTSLPVCSNLFEMEWPKASGKLACFPEIDQLKFFPLEDACIYIEFSQLDFLLRLDTLIQARTNQSMPPEIKKFRSAL